LTDSVQLGYIATGRPTVADVVDRLRRMGARRVYIAPYLLARGVFHTRLADCGADAVAAPLEVHDTVVALVSARFTTGSGDHCGRPRPWARTRPAPQWRDATVSVVNPIGAGDW
jgi:sirohydrochlorin ferrochelatase